MDSDQKAVISPIVLDLDGDGVETTNVNNDWALFDFDGDGVKNRTGWISPDDGFLVFDRNNDGIINDGGELFGNHTLRYDGQGTCADGYQALAQEDTNGDGLVNHLDFNWQYFKVWRDLNQNGQTDEGELFTLDELGITGFEVGFNGEDLEQNGNILQGQGTFYINGEARDFSDVWFEQDFYYSQFPDMEIPEELRDLPVMGGSGKLRPILEACADNESLAALYRRMAEGEGRQAQLSLVEDLLYEWAETSGMTSTVEERLRSMFPGARITHQTGLSVSVSEWNRILHVVEAFNGRYLVDPPDLGNRKPSEVQCVGVYWTEANIQKILKAYNALKDYAYGAVAIQTHLKPYMAYLIKEVDADTQEVSYDFSRLQEHFSRALNTADPSGALMELLDFNQASSFLARNEDWGVNNLVRDIILNFDSD